MNRSMSNGPLTIVRYAALQAISLGVAVWPGFVRAAASDSPAVIANLAQQVGIDQKLDEQIPLDLPFVDDAGRAVRLGDYFDGKPVVLVLAYYRCPMLCTEVLNGLLKSSQAVPLVLSTDYHIVTVSIDPRETPELAREKKRRYVQKYRRDGAETGWHFLTGSQNSITRLADAVGFRYRFEPSTDQFAHASGIIVLTPTGKTSRYFYGIEYPPGDVRLALVDSSAGKIGSAVDRVLLLCYHWDPARGRYGFAIAGALRITGGLTVLVLACFLIVMFRKERDRSRAFARPRADGLTETNS